MMNTFFYILSNRWYGCWKRDWIQESEKWKHYGTMQINFKFFYWNTARPSELQNFPTKKLILISQRPLTFFPPNYHHIVSNNLLNFYIIKNFSSFLKFLNTGISDWNFKLFNPHFFQIFSVFLWLVHFSLYIHIEKL